MHAFERSISAVLCGLCLCTSMAHAEPSATVERTVPSLGFVSLIVSDMEKSLDFYVEQLGLKKASVLEFPGVKEVMLTFSGKDDSTGLLLAQHAAKDESQTAPKATGFGRIAFKVADARKEFAKLKEHGATVEREPVEMKKYGVVIAFLRDPDGYSVELLEQHAKQ